MSKFESRFKSKSVPALNQHFGVTVRLLRGILATQPFTARRSDKTHKTMGAEYGTEVSVTMRDFVLPVASIVLDGVQVAPQTADRIYDDGQIFEIQPPDQNTPSVEKQAGGFEYVVHTKHVGAACHE